MAPAWLLKVLYNGMRLLYNGYTLLLITNNEYIGIGRYCIKARIPGGEFDGEIRLITYFNRRGLSIYSYPQTIPNSVMFCNDSAQVSRANTRYGWSRSTFSHGQLYVALSRVTDVRKLFVLYYPESNRATGSYLFYTILKVLELLFMKKYYYNYEYETFPVCCHSSIHLLIIVLFSPNPSFIAFFLKYTLLSLSFASCGLRNLHCCWITWRGRPFPISRFTTIF